MKRRGNATPGGNAFDLLMKKRQRSTPKSSQKSSRFVDCPVGCGSHVPEHKLNEHIDTCLQNESTMSNEHSDRAKKQTPNQPSTTSSGIENIKESPASSHIVAQAAVYNAEQTQSATKLQPTVSQSPSDPSDNTNAFSHMMKQAHQVFTVKEPLKHRFHLHANGSLTWTDMENETELIQEVWSAKVLLKASRMIHGESTHSRASTLQPRDVELTISSSVPPATEQLRLVKRHSRLSVRAGFVGHSTSRLWLHLTHSLYHVGSCAKVHFAKVYTTASTFARCTSCHGVDGQGHG